jgi:hypothetical protein
VIGPQARCCARLRVGGKERGPLAEVFEVLHDDGGFVRGPCRAVAKCGNQAAWVDVKKGLGFLVRIDFDVLVGYALVFKRDPNALDEWARTMLGRICGKCRCEMICVPESAAIELQVIVFGAVLDSYQCTASGFLVVGFLGGISALVGISHLESDKD